MKSLRKTIARLREKPAWILAALLVLVCMFHLATLRDGHNWGGDFALYIQHALNIVNGRPYADSGYIINPSFQSLSPISYPPGYSLYLLPIVAIFGTDLTPIKVQTVLTFVVALAVIYVQMKGEPHNKFVLPTVAFLGFSPYFWYFKNEVRADILFLLLTMLCLHMLRKTEDAYTQHKPYMWYAGLTGLLMYLSIATRTVGIVLLPAFLLVDVLHHRKVSVKILVILVVVIVLSIIQLLLLPFDSGYLNVFKLDFLTIAFNLRDYWRAFAGFMVSYRGGTVGLIIGYALSCFAGLEYFSRVRHRITYERLFFLFYIGVVVVWPAYQHTRFLIPILPFAVLYTLNGLYRFWGLLLKQGKRVYIAISIVLALLAILAFVNYSQADFHRVHGGVGEPTAQAFFEFIRTHTNPDDVIVFFKPRVLFLYTGRASSCYHEADDAELWSYFESIDAAYLTTGPEDYFHPYWHPFIERNGDRLREVYSDSSLALYQILP